MCVSLCCVVYWEEEVRVCEFVLCVFIGRRRSVCVSLCLCGLLGGGGLCV